MLRGAEQQKAWNGAQAGGSGIVGTEEEDTVGVK